MSTNLILDELHATREKLLAAAGGDLHRYLTEAKLRALSSGRPIAEPTQRTSRCSGAANLGELPVENFVSPPSER